MNIIHKWIIENLPKNSTILEAGVCEGLDTNFFAKTFPDGKIYGFEPIPELFNQALSLNENYNNVYLNQIALGEKTETKSIFVSDRFGKTWGSSSLLKPKEHLNIHKEITFNSEIKVKIFNLDEWCEVNDIDHINLLWLDLQGIEPIVIKSSPEIILKTSYIYTEVSTIETYENVVIYDELKKYMNSIGFEVVFEEILWNDGGNVLFKNKL